MFFSNFSSLKRIFIVGILAYILVIAILRTSGKRSLSKMNAYDFVVTIALGSILASMLTNPDLKLSDGVFAFFLLIMLQYLFSKLVSRFKIVDKLVKSEPTLLYYKGKFYDERMKSERIPRSLVFQAIRSKGLGDLKEVKAVVLETDGTFSIITGLADDEKESSLQNLTLYPNHIQNKREKKSTSKKS